jgi:hypothetical protein
MALYRLEVPFAGEWLTANPRSTEDTYRRAGVVRSWREMVVVACKTAHAPRGVEWPVKVHVFAYYVGRAPVRDKYNLFPTVKACVDGLTPYRTFMRRTSRGVQVVTFPGYGLLPDDSDKWVKDTSVDVLRSTSGRPYVEMVITEVLQ